MCYPCYLKRAVHFDDEKNAKKEDCVNGFWKSFKAEIFVWSTVSNQLSLVQPGKL